MAVIMKCLIYEIFFPPSSEMNGVKQKRKIGDDEDSEIDCEDDDDTEEEVEEDSICKQSTTFLGILV